MRNFLFETKETGKLLLSVLILSAAFTVASAWTNRPSNPPENNTPPPVNVGSVSQAKSGGLGVTHLMADSVTVGDTINPGAVSAPKFCIGTACITSWPINSSGAPALTCVDIVTAPGVSGTSACAALDAACTAHWFFSEFEYFPRGCFVAGANSGQATCCRLGAINYTPPPPPPPPEPEPTEPPERNSDD